MDYRANRRIDDDEMLDLKRPPVAHSTLPLCRPTVRLHFRRGTRDNPYIIQPVCILQAIEKSAYTNQVIENDAKFDHVMVLNEHT